MNKQQLQISELHIEGGTQPRVELNCETIAEYAQQLQEGAMFPPVIAFFDGLVYWLADGFHRYHAHKQAGLETIEAEIREGTLRDAILYSVGANADHGMRRTNQDKRKAVETMLTHEAVIKDNKGNPWSNREIARLCKVDEGTVRKYRKSYTAEIPQYENQNRTFTHPKTGKPAVMKTEKIGKPKPRKQYGQVSPNAFKPVRPAHPQVSQAVVSLPRDTRSAARALVHALGNEFCEKLAEELKSYLNGGK